MADKTAIGFADLLDLLEHYAKVNCEARLCIADSKESAIASKVEALFELDYGVYGIDNTDGRLCVAYPARILVPHTERNPTPFQNGNNTNGHGNGNGNGNGEVDDNKPTNAKLTPITEPSDIAEYVNKFKLDAETGTTNNEVVNAADEETATKAETKPKTKVIPQQADNLNTEPILVNLTDSDDDDDDAGGGGDGNGSGRGRGRGVGVVDDEEETTETETEQPKADTAAPETKHQTKSKRKTRVQNNSSDVLLVSSDDGGNGTPPRVEAGVAANNNHKLPESVGIAVRRIPKYAKISKYARCWRRFVTPVILYKGKYICRSGTVSRYHEAYANKIVDSVYEYATSWLPGATTTTATTNNAASTTTSAAASNANCPTSTEAGAANATAATAATSATANADDDDDDDEEDDENAELEPEQPTNSVPFSYEEVIANDVSLLTLLKVHAIFDLMVEYQKKKMGFAVATSEKVEVGYYKNYELVGIPYPGCEFFAKFRDSRFAAESLVFDWLGSDAPINIPADGPAANIGIDWTDFRSWSLVTITQNYIKAILRYIESDKGGVLVHCISGWDRTPLFVSLLRLTLWADGLIHQSLSALQMTYLTVAYDWFLFGHRLTNRLGKREDIFYFCFHFLRHLTGEEFSLAPGSNEQQTNMTNGNGNGTSSPNQQPAPNTAAVKTDSTNETSSTESQRDSYRLSDLTFSEEDSLDAVDAPPQTTTTTITCPQTQQQQQQQQPQYSSSASSCSSSSLLNKSPNSKLARTSPIQVPINQRQRQESTTSVGSWAIINVDEADTLESEPEVHNTSFCMVGTPNTSFNGQSGPTDTLRQQRLTAVRTIFTKAYFDRFSAKGHLKGWYSYKDLLQK